MPLYDQQIKDNISGNTHYRHPMPSTERLADTVTYLTTGRTSCELK